MTSSVDDVERLSHAVVSLNNDAEGMHELIQKGTEGLRRTIDLEGRAAEELSQSSESLRRLSEEIAPKLDAVGHLVGEARDYFEQASASLSEQVEGLREESQHAAEGLSDVMGERCQQIADDFHEFEEKARKDSREARSDIQDDLLNHKTALSARIDSLENEILGLKKVVQGLEEDNAKLRDEAKRSFRPVLAICAGIVVLQVVSIAVAVLI